MPAPQSWWASLLKSIEKITTASEVGSSAGFKLKKITETFLFYSNWFKADPSHWKQWEESTYSWSVGRSDMAVFVNFIPLHVTLAFLAKCQPSSRAAVNEGVSALPHCQTSRSSGRWGWLLFLLYYIKILWITCSQQHPHEMGQEEASHFLQSPCSVDSDTSLIQIKNLKANSLLTNAAWSFSIWNFYLSNCYISTLHKARSAKCVLPVLLLMVLNNLVLSEKMAALIIVVFWALYLIMCLLVDRVHCGTVQSMMNDYQLAFTSGGMYLIQKCVAAIQ